MKPLKSFSNKILRVAARASALARAQVQEVYQELLCFYPDLHFECTFIQTTGDQDRTTSLRTLGYTDFFTKEIDDLQLAGECDLAIHSAKDLAIPLRKGLLIGALTKGVDASDVLVLRDNESLEKLAPGAKIATSSNRREEAVRTLKNDLHFVDIRGYIEERLEALMRGNVDGVVIAEAALIRLGLTHLNRVKLPGETAPMQGRLAVIIREEDLILRDLLRCIY